VKKTRRAEEPSCEFESRRNFSVRFVRVLDPDLAGEFAQEPDPLPLPEGTGRVDT